MPVIRIFKPKPHWSVSPATVLPGALVARLLRLRWNYTILIDDHTVGKVGQEQVRDFRVDPGEHRLRVRFVGLRRSRELRVTLQPGEEREFLCGANGMGWPTLREA